MRVWLTGRFSYIPGIQVGETVFAVGVGELVKMFLFLTGADRGRQEPPLKCAFFLRRTFTSNHFDTYVLA